MTRQEDIQGSKGVCDWYKKQDWDRYSCRAHETFTAASNDKQLGHGTAFCYWADKVLALLLTLQTNALQIDFVVTCDLRSFAECG